MFASIALAAVLHAPADPQFTPATLPPCAVEDASSGPVPCVWLGSEMGNGVGTSFRVFKAVDPATGDHLFKFISNHAAKRLLGLL